MRRFITVLGVALLGYALLPTAVQAQVIYVQPRPYVQPIIVAQPAYYYAPSVTTYNSSASYSYYPPTTSYYSASPPVFSYSAPPSVITYSAPPVYAVPASGVYTTRTYYGYGVFRPRGYYNETYYTPLR